MTARNRQPVEIAPLVLTVAEAAHALRVGRSTVYQLIDAGKLQRIHVGGAARILPAELNRYIAEQVDAATK